MKNMTKMLIVSASVATMGMLSACQSTPNHHERNSHHDRNSHHMKMHDERSARLSPEQRQQFEKNRGRHQQFRQAMDTACDKKQVGETVQLTVGDRSINGQCEMTFYPERSSKGYMRQAPRPTIDANTTAHNNAMTPRAHDAILTDAQRAELVKQYDQRLIERQTRQQAIASACKGQSHGQSVQIKLGEQPVNGKCMLNFRPKLAVQPTA